MATSTLSPGDIAAAFTDSHAQSSGLTPAQIEAGFAAAPNASSPGTAQPRGAGATSAQLLAGLGVNRSKGGPIVKAQPQPTPSALSYVPGEIMDNPAYAGLTAPARFGANVVTDAADAGLGLVAQGMKIAGDNPLNPLHYVPPARKFLQSAPQTVQDNPLNALPYTGTPEESPFGPVPAVNPHNLFAHPASTLMGVAGQLDPNLAIPGAHNVGEAVEGAQVARVGKGGAAPPLSSLPPDEIAAAFHASAPDEPAHVPAVEPAQTSSPALRPIAAGDTIHDSSLGQPVAGTVVGHTTIGEGPTAKPAYVVQHGPNGAESVIPAETARVGEPATTPTEAPASAAHAPGPPQAGIPPDGVTPVHDAASYKAALQQHFGYDEPTAQAHADVVDALARTASESYPEEYPTPGDWYSKNIAGVRTGGIEVPLPVSAAEGVQSLNDREGPTAPAPAVSEPLSEPAPGRQDSPAAVANARPDEPVREMAGEAAAPARGYTELPLSRIHPAPGDFQDREEPFAELTADAIHQEGYNPAKYNPIPVFKDTQGKYGPKGDYVVAGDGHSRYEGFRRLDADGQMPPQIPVKIVSESDAGVLKTEANTSTTPFTPLELASVYQHDLDAGKPIKDIALTHHKSITQVRDGLALNNLTPYLRMMVKANGLKPDMAAALGKWIGENKVEPADADNLFTKFVAPNQLTRTELEQALGTITQAHNRNTQLGFGGLLEGSVKGGESFVTALGRLTAARREAAVENAAMARILKLANKHGYSAAFLKEAEERALAAQAKVRALEQKLAIEQSPNLKKTLAAAENLTLTSEDQSEQDARVAREKAKEGHVEYNGEPPDTLTIPLFQGGNAPTFYSHLEQSLLQKMPNRASAQQVRGMLQGAGVKPDELKWSGFDDFLNNATGPITKEEALAAVRAGQVNLQEVMKGAPGPQISLADIDAAERRGDWAEHDRLTRIYEDQQLGNDANQTGNETKFGSYQLPGGENYRELLLTLPERDNANTGRYRVVQDPNGGWGVGTFDSQGNLIARGGFGTFNTREGAVRDLNKYMEHYEGAPAQPRYNSSHWDEPNVLAHVRFNDRTGPNGEKILHVEEVQSDWHQEGRSKGYADTAKPFAVFESSDPDYAERFATRQEAEAYMRDHPDDMLELADERRGSDTGRVPSAPFSKTWHELALKRVLRYAAENGYDRVSWTPGEEQAARYDLSKQVDRVAYNPQTQTLFAFKDGSSVLEQKTPPEKLPDYIGKEAAQKLLNAPTKTYHPSEGPVHELHGEDLKVGGEGMKGFYDKIVPDFLNKYGKKFGAQVEPTRIETAVPEGYGIKAPNGEWASEHRYDTEQDARTVMRQRGWPSSEGYQVVEDKLGSPKPVPSLPITPALRKSVMETGQPLFQGPKGAVSFTGAGRAIIHALASPDASTAIHEIGHVLVRTLRGADLDAVERWNGGPLAQWTVAQQERFARAWERYLHDGAAPTDRLKAAFAVMKAAMARVYAAVKGSPIEERVAPEIKAVFDRVLGGADKEPGEAGATEGKYAGSVNMRLFHGDADAAQEVRDTAARLGLDNKTRYTQNDIHEFGKSLGISYADIERMTPGTHPAAPQGIDSTLWQAAYADAVRNLHAQSKADFMDARRAAQEARDEHADAPSEKTQKALDAANVGQAEAQRISDLMQVHDDKMAQNTGTALSIRNRESTPIKGEGYQKGLAEAPTLKEAGVGKTQRLAPSARTSRRIPSRVRTVSKEDAQAAIERVKARGGVRVLHQEPSGDVLFQSREPSDSTQDLVTIGRYHWEDGDRDPEKWRAAVEKSIGAKLSTPDAEYVRLLVKADIQKDVQARQAQALKPLFVDRLGHEMTAKGAAQFLTDIGPDLRDKLISGAKPEEFTPAEKSDIQRTYDANQPARKKPVTKAAATVAKQIADDARTQSRRSRTKNAPAQDLDHILARRVKGGLASTKAIRADLGNDPLGKSALDKLTGGHDLTNDEGRRLARSIDNYRRTTAKTNPNELTKRITTLITDARTGRLGYDNPKEAARAQLYADATHGLTGMRKDTPRYERVKAESDKKVAQIGRDLDSVGDHDSQAIARVMIKHTPLSDKFNQYVLNNILSSPDTALKIAVAHPATVAAEDLRRWFFGGKSEVGPGIRAGLAGAREKGLPDAWKIIREGPTVAALEGKNLYRGHGGRIPTELGTPGFRLLMRAHSAFYQLMQIYNAERGLHLLATEEGKAKGLTGAELEDYATDVRLHPGEHRDLVEKAIAFGREETQTNPNVLTQSVNRTFNRLGPGGRVAKTVLQPVLNIGLNAAGRSLESTTGLLTNVAMARAYEYLHPDATAADIAAYQKKVMQRGAIGAGMAGIAALAAFGGILLPPDPKHGRYTSAIRIGPRQYEMPAGNVGAVADTGAILGHALRHPDLSVVGGVDMARQLAAVQVNANPIFRTMGNVSDVASGITGNVPSYEQKKAIAQGGANVTSELIPYSGALRFSAAASDANKGLRKATSYTQDVERGLPGLRGTLPFTADKMTGHPYPQPIFHSIPAESAGEIKEEDAENYAALHKGKGTSSGAHRRARVKY